MSDNPGWEEEFDEEFNDIIEEVYNYGDHQHYIIPRNPKRYQSGHRNCGYIVSEDQKGLRDIKKFITDLRRRDREEFLGVLGKFEDLLFKHWVDERRESENVTQYIQHMKKIIDQAKRDLAGRVK